MNDSQNITISLLVISAVILTALLVGTYFNTQQPAYGDTPARAGRYIGVTGAIAASRDLLYLTDVVADQLNVYGIDINTKSIKLIQAVDLKRIFAAKEGG